MAALSLIELALHAAEALHLAVASLGGHALATLDSSRGADGGGEEAGLA